MLLEHHWRLHPFLRSKHFHFSSDKTKSQLHHCYDLVIWYRWKSVFTASALSLRQQDSSDLYQLAQIEFSSSA